MASSDSFAGRILARLPESGMRFGLDRIQAACDALGRPQGAYPVVHVAGTNGKGSTSAMLAAALGAAGLRVGLYTSPHLLHFRERIRIDGAPISEAALDASMQRLWAAGDFVREPAQLSYFETATALAFDAFAHAGVEIAVVEVGLGGRLDATNVGGKDLRAAVISRVAQDHASFLGRDLGAIAREKGAIARAGRPLVLGPQRPEAREALVALARDVGAELVDVETETSLIPTPQGLAYRGPRWELQGIRLGLLGPHQIENAHLALATLERMDVAPEAARQGLAEARWPGRLQVVSEAPLTVVDGAHNPDAAAALAAAWRELWPDRRPHLVFGALGDKDWPPMLGSLLPLAETVHLCPPVSDRAVPPERLLEKAPGAFVHPNAGEAIETATRLAGRGGAVLVAGSLYLVGEALALFGWEVA